MNRLVLLLAGVVGASACGSSSDGGGGPDAQSDGGADELDAGDGADGEVPLPEPDETCRGYAATFCAGVSACCEGGVSEDVVAGCEDQLAEACASHHAFESEHYDVVIDAAGAEGCFARLEERLAGCDPFLPELAPPYSPPSSPIEWGRLPECAAMAVYPAVAEGASCVNDSQCPEGTRCVEEDWNAESPPMSCLRQVTPAAIGEPCDRPRNAAETPECEVGAHCDYVLGECVVLRGQDEPCGTSADCAGGLFCDEGGGGDGTCDARRGEGEECDGPLQCAEGLFCDDEAGHCSALLAEGEECSNRSPEPSCLAGYWCNGSTCVHPTPPADYCDPMSLWR